MRFAEMRPIYCNNSLRYNSLCYNAFYAIIEFSSLSSLARLSDAMRPPITSSNYGGNNQVTCEFFKVN